MGEHKSPHDADLHWPVARGELDDLATLELGPDDAGKLTWQNMTPPGPDTYRAWLPRREHLPSRLDAAADGYADDPVMSLFASETPAASEPVHPLEPPTPTPLVGWAEPSLMRAPAPPRAPLPELPLTAPSVSTGVAATTSTSMPFWSAAVPAPLRLSLALTSAEARRPLSPVPPVPPVALPGRSLREQMALLGTGAVFGVIAALAFSAAVWRPGPRPASRPMSALAGVANAPADIPAGRLPVATVPLARAVVPGVRVATLGFSTIRPATTSVARAPASPPADAPTAHAAAAVAPPRHGAAVAPRAATGAGNGTAAARATAAATPLVAPPEALATVGRFAAAYNRMDAGATQAVWPTADHQALVTTFTALREQRLTLSGCRGTVEGDTATVICRGMLRYRPRVGNHDTLTQAGTWRFTMLQRAEDWVVNSVETP